ncbi:uncharacterized protein LOC113215881 [Frankliniella occidentalis]|uniref:Uncharacterized protein LOC113215881 n=1 Tax=Frankliniella occidentalis TaxID=133901 RepID=A0A6J1TDJ8_FRAOC|nr:uncharacterized protein LOC113215881 [Frankliniella occidentalis]
MNTIMKTTVLACLLVAALQFSQAIPLAAPAESTNTLAVRGGADQAKCVMEIVGTLFKDVPAWIYICVEQAQKDPSLPLFIQFPICAAITGGADFVRLAMDVVQKCH